MLQKINFSNIFFIVFLIFMCFNKAQAQNLDKLHSSIEELKDSLRIPGLSYAVVKDEETILMNSLGYANVDDKIEETNQTEHFIASTTKTITGIGLMKLVETGKIKLDDPISLYLDNVHASWKKVTIRQAVSHTSGLPNILNENGDPIGGGTIEQSWDIVKQKPLVREPGKKWEYNQAGLEVIQRIYKKLSNQSWELHIKETVFEPADMSNTTWLWDQPQKSPNLSVVYELTSVCQKST